MKCRDIAEKYGVSALQVGKRRKQFFPANKGGELSNLEIDVLTEYYESLTDIDTRKDMEEAVKPQIIDGYVTYATPKSRFIECKIRQDGGIVTVRALIPNGSDGTRFLFKPIKLETINYKNKNFYRHASLANVAWPENLIN